MNKKYTETTYEIKDAYKELVIEAEDAKVRIEGTECDNTKLVFLEKKRRPYKFSIQDGKLIIQSTKRRWYHLFGRIGIDHSKITLFVPKSIPGGIEIKTTVGCVEMHSINCDGTATINTNTGNINIENLSCKAFNSKENTGFTSLNNIVAKESISVKQNTGKVLLNDCLAPEIFVKTNTGRVYGKLSPNMAFTARSNTGKIELPKAPLGEVILGRCEIKTNTGSIKFE